MKWTEVLNMPIVGTQPVLTRFHFIERCPQTAVKTETHSRVVSGCVFECQLLQMEIINDSPDLIKAPSLAGDCYQLFAIFLLCRRSKRIWSHSRAEPQCGPCAHSTLQNSPPHPQQLLHVLAGPSTVTESLADNFIADVTDEVLCLEPQHSLL